MSRREGFGIEESYSVGILKVVEVRHQGYSGIMYKISEEERKIRELEMGKTRENPSERKRPRRRKI